jgi:hypothetical protein
VLNTTDATPAVYQDVEALMGSTEGWWIATLSGPHGGLLADEKKQEWLKKVIPLG